MPLPALTLRCSICKSTGHKANHCPFAVIDALNEKESITTSLVRALESVPPSIASSSDDETSHHNDEQEDDGDTESILEDADALQQYLTSSEQPIEESTEETTTQSPSPESTASTVAQSTPVNTPFLFSAPTSPETQFASVTLPQPEQPAIPTAKPPPVTKKSTTKPGTHKMPPTIAHLLAETLSAPPNEAHNQHHRQLLFLTLSLHLTNLQRRTFPVQARPGAP